MANSGNHHFLNSIYELGPGQPMRDTYDQWADSYDEDIQACDYRTPARVAQALARHLTDSHAPIFDFGCGTGLSGQALHEAGFTSIDGVDLSEKMLRKALHKGIYRSLAPCAIDAPFDAVTQAHRAIVAVGAIGAGAAPLACLSLAIERLPAGGLFGVSLNDHTLEDPRYAAVINDAAQAAKVKILESEYGEHLPDIGLGARVYVLRKC
jgi:predicted TPR repeat methyltransferase